MEYIIDNQFLRDCLEELTNVLNPISYYEETNPVVEKHAAMFEYQVAYDREHTPYITMKGEDNSKTVLIGGHPGTLGMMVRWIDDDGSIRIRNLDGLSYIDLEGETARVVIRDSWKYSGPFTCQSHSIHVSESARSLGRGEGTILIRLGEEASTKAEVEVLGIRCGDIIYVEPRSQYTEKGFIKSRLLDGKAAVTSVFGVLKYVTEQKLKPKYRTLLVFPHYEEIGYGGTYLPSKVEEFVTVDIGLIGPNYNDNEYAVSIYCKDFYSSYDKRPTIRVINQIKKVGCDYTMDIFHRYSIGASVTLEAGNSVYVAAIGMACYHSHGMERIHTDGLNNTAKLLAACVLGI